MASQLWANYANSDGAVSGGSISLVRPLRPGDKVTHIRYPHWGLGVVERVMLNWEVSPPTPMAVARWEADAYPPHFSYQQVELTLHLNQVNLTLHLTGLDVMLELLP